MSVLIKGMRMPENCSECLVALSGKYCRINKTYTTYIKLPLRPDHCPLVEIPEKHGDLIDRDELLRDIEHYHLSDGKFQNWVEIQQAVIEEEDGTCTM